MTRLKHSLHDLWCLLTNRCAPNRSQHDPTVVWMRKQEQASRQKQRQRAQRDLSVWFGYDDRRDEEGDDDDET